MPFISASFRQLNQDAILCLSTTFAVGVLGGAISRFLCSTKVESHNRNPQKTVYVVLTFFAIATLFFILSWRTTATLSKIATNVAFYTSLIGSYYCKRAQRAFCLTYAVTAWTYLWSIQRFGAYLWFLDAARLYYGRNLGPRRVTVTAIATILLATLAGSAAMWLFRTWHDVVREPTVASN